MDEKKVAPLISPDENSETKTKVNARRSAKAVKKNKTAEDFKKRYFEYYDDIKISDRQDW